ncbi:MAG TPA: tetratricopeptide repeat protein [Kiritimatiellia bacterium]|nr:tetratricopeptide repeat protein [Kiritimatiellia bacterium]
MRYPEFMVPLIDASTYDTFARQWVEFGQRDSTTVWHAAFYPIFLAAVYRLFTPSIFAALLIQSALGAAACCGVALIARRCLGEKAFWPAGLMAAGYGPLIFYDAQLMPAGWAFFWSVLIMARLVHPEPGNPWVRGILHGALCAGAALIRPELLVGYVGGQALLWINTIAKSKVSRQCSPIVVLTAVTTFLVLVMPVGIMNRPWTGTYTLGSANGALNLYLANAPEACDTMLARPGPTYDRIVNLPKQAGLRSPSEQNQFFRERFITRVKEHPADVTRHLLRKAAMLFNGYEVPTDLDLYSARPPAWFAQGMMFPIGRGGFPFSLLVLLAGLGISRAAHQKLMRVYIVYGLIAACLILLMPTARYRLILLPPLFVLGAGGLLQLLDKQTWRNLRRQPGVVLTLGLLLFLQIAPLPLCRLDWNFAAERERMIAQRMEDPITATEKLTRIQQTHPEDPQLYYFLAYFAWQLGEQETARHHLLAALELAPDFAYALLLKAEVDAHQGELTAAQKALESATRSDPDLEEAYLRLALIHAQAGDFKAARDTLQRLLAYRNHHPIALHILADLYIQNMQASRAATLLEKLLEKNPDQPDLHASAAQAAWQLQRISQARHHALEALRLQPDHSRARALMEEMNRQ